MTGLLQREAESSRLVGRDGVPASVAVVGTGVWPGISSEICVLSVKAGTAAKSLQSCTTLCDPIDGNPPGSPIPGILQARILEWDVEEEMATHSSVLAGKIPWTALARDGVSREVPCSALKGETVPDSLPATPKSPPTRRVPPRALSPSLLLCTTQLTNP